MNNGESTINEPVSKTVMTLTMVHPTSLDPQRMDVIDIANHMTAGEFVGTKTLVETNPVADEKVDAEVTALGGNAGFFADKGPFLGTVA
jgi:hypothetical protein